VPLRDRVPAPRPRGDERSGVLVACRPGARLQPGTE
jgi:hypothetical protein